MTPSPSFRRALPLLAFLLLSSWAHAAPPPLAGRAYELADQAQKATQAGRLERAVELVTLALREAPGHGGLLAQRGYLYLRTKNTRAAEADFAAAIEGGQLEPGTRGNLASELGYLALRRQDDAAALKWFRAALDTPRPGAARGALYADAGYAAARAGRNDEAVELLSKAVDAWHDAPEGAKPFDERALFGARRSIDTLSRRFGATFSLGRGNQTTAASGIGGTGGDIRVVQAGAELWYMPGSIGYRDGRIFQLYANMFQGVRASDDAFATGSESRVGGFGARYKPLRDLNLVLAVERRFGIGDRAGEDDWLLRAGFSAGRGTDWDSVRPSWTTWQVYTESAWFTDASRLIQPFDARVGYSWKLPASHGTVITPFLGIAGEYDDAQSERWAAGIGPGIVARHWFRESRTRAFASYVEVSVQARKRLTDARRGGGLFGYVMVAF